MNKLQKHKQRDKAITIKALEDKATWHTPFRYPVHIVNRFGNTFIAQYDGKCGRCNDPITAGQNIRYDSDGDLIHTVHRRQVIEYQACKQCNLTVVLDAQGYCGDCAGV